MDNSIQEQESDTRDRQSLLAGPLIFNQITNWLLSLVKLTEEEQQNAGIYPGRLGDE